MSLTISRGWNFSVLDVAAMIAAISPTWFNWFFPGILRAMFILSLGPNHTPLPHHAFTLPLLKHAPSVYTVTFWCLESGPCSSCHFAGRFDSLSLFVNMQKHSPRFSLQVIVGSNRISPLFSFAMVFCTLLLLVSERFPYGGIG